MTAPTTSPLTHSMERPLVHPAGILTLGVVVALAAVSLPRGQQASTPGTGCGSAPSREFDFFVGDWDGYDLDAPSKVVARNRVTRTLGGCVVQERYEQSDGLVGESFSIYDASRHQWHQSWVTNRGALLLLDGGLQDGRMVLTGTEQASDGSTTLLRGVWRVQGADVREVAERSSDGGQSWTPVFDILFHPHARQGGP